MTNLDSLHIKGLAVETHIGVHAWEQQILQRLLIDITIPADFSACEDELSKTIDYDRLCQLVTAYIETNSFQLIETVADKIANLIKTEFKIQQVSISVSKPHAIKNAANIQVNVTR
ncbi:Dihydroneopterin aldolase [Legionella massiliensis]|uniref:7,8-dihydroneopterin aldolase n=1 Tax=Legionella massiliensis TaxID=1034943 RepID=A0A078L0W6_9GAMM|nr:Dihydroneopterin aldolase [Legionella massiliensis]CEE13426.1 Dihydroneopterin aldolase [Legionella massiliensis]